MFERSFVINLPFKTDRLAEFQKSYPPELPPAQVWPAVHGDSIKHPSWWKAGNGAWGCYRSHMQILEYCYQNGVESYIVFEDDAIFRADAAERIQGFMREVPPDWQQIYFGGQLLHTSDHPPIKISDRVYQPYNVNRTHCFAVHKRGYERLYTHLNETPFAQKEHIDHHSGRLHESGTWKVYCPDRWTIGQNSGKSNISGNFNSAMYWLDPCSVSASDAKAANRVVPSIFLECRIEVAVELERRGWHRGHWQNDHHLDRGICDAIAGLDLRGGIEAWFKAVSPEAVREGSRCVCLYHPSLSIETVNRLNVAKFTHIKADNADHAESQLNDVISQASPSPDKRPCNLIYHIWPRSGSDAWRWNVAQLVQRMKQFDGVRSIAIAESDDADAVSEVKKAFGDERIDNWIIVTNDRGRGEGASFVKLLETLPKNDGSITFYGHAKGVSYIDANTNREWTEALYETCLDDNEFVQACMKENSAAGPFKSLSPGWDTSRPNHWHYSGTFLWFKNSDVFANPRWSVLGSDFYGVERWVGCLFPSGKGADLFGAGMERLHEPEHYKKMQTALEEWRRMRRKPANETDERLSQ